MRPGDRVVYYTGRGGPGRLVSVHESEGFAIVEWDDGLGPRQPYLNTLRPYKPPRDACMGFFPSVKTEDRGAGFVDPEPDEEPPR